MDSSAGRLRDVAMDSSTMQRWTACNACDEQIVKNGLAMEQWTARQCRDGRLTMDSLAQWTAWQWTA
jgi:hypothetical protein